MKLVDDIEGSNGLAEEDKDFLKSLEKMAEEIENEVKVLIKEDPAARTPGQSSMSAELGGKGER